MEEEQNIAYQKSSGQMARMHRKIAIFFVSFMVLVLLGVTAWLIHMSNSYDGYENLQAPNMNIPITTSKSNIVTKKKENVKNEDIANVPRRQKRPKNTKPRTVMTNVEVQESSPESLPSGIVAN